jgi:hypothetical protein
MKRSGPPKRKTWMRRKREKPRRRLCGDMDEPAYIDWIHEQTMCGLVRAFLEGRLPEHLRQYLGRCSRRMEAEHERQHQGKGQKAPDRRAWECCSLHHRQRHSKRGVWFHLSLEQERTLIEGNVDSARARYMSHGSRRAA